MSEVPPVPPTPPPSAVPPSMSGTADNDRLMVALEYLITPIVPILALVSQDMKNRALLNYHAIQALGLFVAELLLSVVACVIFFACSIVSMGILAVCLWVLFFLPVIPQIYYAYIGYTNPTFFEIPTLTQFMVQQGWLKRPVA